MKPEEIPDLQAQFEDLLHTVFEAEDHWRFMDRIDLALKEPPNSRSD